MFFVQYYIFIILLQKILSKESICFVILLYAFKNNLVDEIPKIRGVEVIAGALHILIQYQDCKHHHRLVEL